MVMDMMTQGAPPAPAGPPPDLAAALGLAGGPPGAGPEAGPGAGPGLGPTPGADPNDELGALDAVLEAVDAYIAIPTVSEGEKLIMEKVSTMVQQLKAQNEKMADQISGGSPAARKAFG